MYVEDDYVIAHELAHTYWPFWPAWIAEGGADFMPTVSVNKQFSSTIAAWGTLYPILIDSMGSLRKTDSPRV